MCSPLLLLPDFYSQAILGAAVKSARQRATELLHSVRRGFHADLVFLDYVDEALSAVAAPAQGWLGFRSARSLRCAHLFVAPAHGSHWTLSSRFRRLCAHETLDLGCGTTAHPAWENLNQCCVLARRSRTIFDYAPYPTPTFDAMYHSLFLWHFERLEGGTLLRECFRALKHGDAVRISASGRRKALSDVERTLCEPIPIDGVRGHRPGYSLSPMEVISPYWTGAADRAYSLPSGGRPPICVLATKSCEVNPNLHDAANLSDAARRDACAQFAWRH